MDFGDIIYYVLLVFFMILGFFNNSKKKKASEKSQTNQPQPERDLPTFEFPKIPETFKNINRRKTPPPVPVTKTERYKRPEFQSSMDLVTDFEGESSLKGSIYVDDGTFKNVYERDRITSSEKTQLVHPLIKDLHSANLKNEIRKGIIYGEILKPKY